ncbi:MAG: twin-arginine translocation signal domain-containing protein [Stellaceae bacterium]
MLSTEVDRRNVLKTAGIGGITAITGVQLSPALAAMTQQRGSERLANLAAWVRTRTDGGAVFTLASSKLAEGLEVVWQPAFSHTEPSVKAKTASSWAARQAAYDTARALLVSLAARNWEVDTRDCRLQESQVVHEKSGCSIGYLIWAEVE